MLLGVGPDATTSLDCLADASVLAQPDGELDLVCLSGRGDKDLAEVLGDA